MDQFMTTRQAAKATGIPQRTLQDWIRRGLIAALRPGGPGTQAWIPRDSLNDLVGPATTHRRTAPRAGRRQTTTRPDAGDPPTPGRSRPRWKTPSGTR